MLNSLSFCLSVKLLSSPSYLNKILAGYSNLGCRFFSFITLSMSCHSLLAWSISIDRSAVILMGIPLCVICYFSLAAFNSCSLCLIFVNLINMCLGVFRLGFILFKIGIFSSLIEFSFAEITNTPTSKSDNFFTGPVDQTNALPFASSFLSHYILLVLLVFCWSVFLGVFHWIFSLDPLLKNQRWAVW